MRSCDPTKKVPTLVLLAASSVDRSRETIYAVSAAFLAGAPVDGGEPRFG